VVDIAAVVDVIDDTQASIDAVDFLSIDNKLDDFGVGELPCGPTLCALVCAFACVCVQVDVRVRFIHVRIMGA
jgi:hypothetical protein